jgi:hypothetical protein
MKLSSLSTLLPLWLALSAPVHAQISRAYPDGVLVPSSQAKPVQLAAAGDSAVVLPRFTGNAVVHERVAGAWSPVQTLGGTFSAVAMNSAGDGFAIARPGRIDLYSRSSPGNWVLYGSAYLLNPHTVTKLAFEGERVVALVDTRGSGTVPGGRVVRVYDYNAADWEMVKEITVANPEPFVPLGEESVVSDFSYHADRLVVGSDAAALVRVHERNQGGAGQWGTTKQITAAGAGVAALGHQVALDGDRLAVATLTGGNHRLDVFSRNLGGTNQWGFAGSLFTAPARPFAKLALRADPATGRLAAVEAVLFSSFDATPEPTRLWIFNKVPGAGIGDWLAAADTTIGPVNGYDVAPPGLGFATDDLLVGTGPADAAGIGASWLASVHRRDSGGAGAWQLQQTLAGPGTATRLGQSIATSRSYVAVGMPDDSAAGLGSGSVLLWYQAKMDGGSRWLPIGRFEASTPAAGARFGAAVTVFESNDEAWLAVGAPGENSGRGAVYLFPLNPIYPEPAHLRLVPATVTLDPADEFGASVSFWPNFHLAVGAPGDDGTGSNAGAAYLFEKDLRGVEAWGQRRKIERPAGEVLTGFGSDLVFTAESLAIALPPGPAAPGKVFHFEADTGGTSLWGQSALQLPPAGSPQGFATSLAADPRFPYLVIGATGQAPDDKSGVPEIPGKAFVYSINSAGNALTLLDELGGTAAEGHGFGGSVASSTVTRIVVGNAGFAGRGKTFTYDVTGPVPDWSLFHTREGSLPGDGLGLAVAALPLFTFSGAPWSDAGGSDAGAVFIDRSGSYELWAANQGPGFTDWFPEQDADGDGLANLGEFGLGGDPRSASSRPPLTMVRTTFVNGGTTWPALRWEPPALPYPVGMLRYQMQRSTTLQGWSDTNPDGGFGLGDPSGHFFRIEFPREFFRIHFRYPAPPTSGGLVPLE